MDEQPPIADYALLGDGRTSALVSREGSIDWLPWPDVDAASLFGAILDAQRGGRFSVAAHGPGAARRRYLEGTNCLETWYDTPTGEITLTDFLAVGDERALVRLVRGTAGRAALDMICEPRPDYGASAPRIERIDERSVRIRGGWEPLVLSASAPLTVEGGRIVARIVVGAGESGGVVLSPAPLLAPCGSTCPLLERTSAFWRGWLGQLRYDGPYREHVERSALVLKALIYEPSGAIAAAPTTSLPERPGGVRNWDYRFSWLRDATLTLAALHGIGYRDEARRFFQWLLRTSREHDPSQLQVLYGLRGEREVDERDLPHLRGYRGARPVRVGNSARGQLQLDAWGELIYAFYVFRDLLETQPPDHELYRHAVCWIAKHWRDPDNGIWEVRSERRQFVHSKAMCWLGLDCGVRLEGDSPLGRRLSRERDAVRDEVMARGFDPRAGTFIRAYDQPSVDAALLRLPLIGFVEANDPRMVATVDRIRRELSSYQLLYRYHDGDDGLPEGEMTFAPCTFWLVENLALQGRAEEADALFRTMLSYGNDVGLFAEEIDPRTSRQWGNFPQAFTHLGLIRAAMRLHHRWVRPRPDDPLAEW